MHFNAIGPAIAASQLEYFALCLKPNRRPAYAHQLAGIHQQATVTATALDAIHPGRKRKNGDWLAVGQRGTSAAGTIGS